MDATCCALAKRFTPLLPTLRKDICDFVACRRYTRDVYRWTLMVRSRVCYNICHDYMASYQR